MKKVKHVTIPPIRSEGTGEGEAKHLWHEEGADWTRCQTGSYIQPREETH